MKKPYQRASREQVQRGLKLWVVALIVIAVILVLAFGRWASAAEASLTWTPPTENEDGTALTDLAGYNVYYGPTSGNYPTSINVPDPGAASFVVPDLTDGAWFFAVTAYDTSGNESGYSNEATKVIAIPPAPPANLSVGTSTVYSIVKQNDGILLVAIGDIAAGTACDVTQTVNGKYVVPASEVSWYDPAQPPPRVVVADCL